MALSTSIPPGVTVLDHCRKLFEASVVFLCDFVELKRRSVCIALLDVGASVESIDGAGQTRASPDVLFTCHVLVCWSDFSALARFDRCGEGNR